MSKPVTNPDDVFELYKVLATGRYSAVYLGYERGTSKKFSFKVYRPLILRKNSSSFEKQFLSLCYKPAIIPKLFYTFSFEFQNCLVLEQMTGKSLHDQLKFARRFTNEVTQFYLAEIAVAVSFLHSKNIIHRNLQLDSFWIQSDGHLRLTDYTRCISSKTIFPTFDWQFKISYYTPPEIVRGGRVTKMVDMWAVGIMFYRMISGRMPFYCSNRNKLREAIRYKPMEVSRYFTPDGQALCYHLLTKTPSLRLGADESTFIAFERQNYFDGVDWRQVVKGTLPAPHIPILFATMPEVLDIENETILDLKVTDSVRMRLKPLRYKDISTKEGGELFNDETLDLLHRRKIATDVRRQEKKRTPSMYSFLRVKETALPRTSLYSIQSKDSSGGKSQNSPGSLKSPDSRRSSAGTDERLSITRSFEDALHDLEEHMSYVSKEDHQYLFNEFKKRMVAKLSTGRSKGSTRTSTLFTGETSID
ncbi:RAC-gamma serine/threonine-protein kinase-like [Physella acuta]|uniref:RAC-gamma serine/threonine-protein kinase-like n=1 Tax=Physella acuta TaxID=109671 RepID=UPI0027DC6642|nr:RAC-gamma serine/threonine-protein kinase-like [Physella acuta]